MASMFGKPRVSTERPPQSPVAECNVAILGCRGAGKSGGSSAEPQLLYGFLGTQHRLYCSIPAPVPGSIPETMGFCAFGQGKSFSAIIPGPPGSCPWLWLRLLVLHAIPMYVYLYSWLFVDLSGSSSVSACAVQGCVLHESCREPQRSPKIGAQKPCLCPTALTVKFLTKRFISEYDPNLEDTYTSEELVDHQPVLLKVMDTADQDGPVNCERYLCWANAFLVVYSIDDRRSFEGCSRYLDVLARHAQGCQRRSPVLLLGNKLDMEQYRQVTKAEGTSLATKFGCLFFEVSACQDFAAVQHVFHQAVRELRREAERGPALRPLFIAEEQPCLAMATRHSLPSCTINTLSTVNLKEIPSVAQAKLVTVKSSRAQSKRKAPTLTLLKGFKIF
ncbi:ras-like protein family member 12 isoform X2 [Numida meleagris]|nr:ras-like protein family member 12 isoform X2 [Numida meleagris]